MRKIDKALYKEIISPALIALLVLTFVVFSREFGRLAEMLIRKNADALTVFAVVLSLLPAILVFTIPISFLMGVLIGFSRLSSDSEIVAMQANGISIHQMVWPVLKVGIGVTLMTLVLTLFLLPTGNWNLRQIRHEVGLRPVRSEIKPRVFNEDLPDKVLYVQDMDLSTSSWKGVFLADTTPGAEQKIILAKQGIIVLSPDSRKLQLQFQSGSIYTVNKQSPEKNSLARFETQDAAVRFPEMEGVSARPKRPEDKNVRELLTDLRHGPSETGRPSRVELHSRIALPLSALVFAVLGVTLGVNTHRGGRSYGFILSVTIAFIYYLCFATGTELAANGILPLGLGVWGGNVLLAGAALWTLGSVTSTSRVMRAITDSTVILRLLEVIQSWLPAAVRAFRRMTTRILHRVWNPSLGLRMTRVIDFYIIRGFLFFLALTLAICVSLFYLFTFLELVDDIFAHHAGRAVVLDYFVYLLPHILMLLVPMSILIATLVTFGIFDKANEIIAFKSCGVSLYRLSLPVFALSLVVSAFLFVMQEYILPYSNQRQDNLRNVIKGRPIQTFYHPGRKWIFGEGHRLYTYNYFDSEHGIFAEISIFQVDISANRLNQHISAQKAEWDAGTQTWKLTNGWIRNFNGNGNGFVTFEQTRLPLPEGPDYFVKEVKESSKMTYSELKAYVLDLQKGGFEVDHLKTELYKKIAFPIVNIIMALLGVPFAFSMGRKGALYGIAVGVLMGIVYWGAFGVFGVLGVNGLLSPLLAAWGPNLLFGAGGVLLLLSVRT